MAVTVTSVSYTSAKITASASSTATNDRYWTIYLDGYVYDYVYNKAQSISYEFDGLDEGTTYSVKVRYGPNYDDWSAGSATFTTKTSVTYPSTDYGSCSIKSVTSTSVLVSLDYITPRDYERTVYFHWYNTKTGAGKSPYKILEAYGTEKDREMPNLTTGTEYRFYITVENPAGVETYRSSYMYATPSAYDYTLSLTTSSTATTISATVTLNAVQSYDVDLTLYLDDDRSLEADIAAGSLSRTRTWGTTTPLTPATKYVVKLKDKLRDKEFTQTRRTKNNFAWSTTVATGEPFIITAADWNEYTSQLSSKASYYGKDYNPATVKKGDALTAEKYNNIAAVINWLVDNNKGDCTTKLNGVSTGDPVTAAKIKNLAKCLNE